MGNLRNLKKFTTIYCKARIMTNSRESRTSSEAIRSLLWFDMVLCNTCQISDARYNCPGCNLASCSLQCSQSHKSKMGCTGKRNPVNFIPRSKFDISSVNNDYNFLTSLERELDNAARRHSGNDHGRHINQVRSFVKRAKDVGEVSVLLAPRGMKRAKMNKSAWMPKKNQLSWTVEWRFGGSERKVSERVLHSTTLLDAVTFYLQKIGEHVASFQEVRPGDLYYLLRNEGLPDSQVTYAKLDVQKSLGEALRHRTVIEFPTIYVFTKVPPHIKLERQYEFAQPVTTKLATVNGPQSFPARDFISLGVDDDGEEETTTEVQEPVSLSSFGLPILDLDDLQVPE